MRTLEQYKELFFKKFPFSKLKILSFEKTKYVLVEDVYGICKVDKFGLMIGNIPTIQTAINKNEYFINQATKIHGDKYDYSKVLYLDMKSYITIICKKHGEFLQLPDKHLQMNGCPKCGKLKQSKNKTRSLNIFIEKANIVHNFKYDYSNATYTTGNKSIKIICPIHGEFEQVSNTHLNGSGCQFCGRINVLKYNSENPTGWTKIDWFNAAKKSKKFDSFKVYIIKCWNEEEEFYKIGRTYKKVEYRFSHKKALPYNYKIIQLYEFQELTEENCNKCYDLETEMKKKNKDNSYIPKLEFVGKYECFNKIKFDF